MNKNIYSEDHFVINFDNCYFENVKSFGELGFGNVIVNNSYFTKFSSLSDKNYAILYSSSYGNKIKFFNSTFENIKINYDKPLFHVFRTSLDSEFNDISTLIYGEYNKLDIINSKFHNLISRSSIPLILDSIYSDIYITNTEFYNITGLVNEESNYYFKGVKFYEIESNSKSMIPVTYNNISFDNCQFTNILCNGDMDDSSLIKFQSSVYGNTFEISNSDISNCISNGDLIKFDGSKSSVTLSNFDVQLNNVIVNENENVNKFKCGIINNSNNVKMSINNSEFKKNSVKNNGGVL
ncbi:hypothetical protein PIROE2DRAFT_13408 [Piromyces sp. E2]|nr:hypothetical protein PIROE2DRAFT_13408 [Piromyces sp. E2]|eukprot:OUM60770.1 hypothetical protein PIROE2DRAFT_13408 [Piromyces sp. E2]